MSRPVLPSLLFCKTHSLSKGTIKGCHGITADGTGYRIITTAGNQWFGLIPIADVEQYAIRDAERGAAHVSLRRSASLILLDFPSIGSDCRDPLRSIRRGFATDFPLVSSTAPIGSDAANWVGSPGVLENGVG